MIGFIYPFGVGFKVESEPLVLMVAVDVALPVFRASQVLVAASQNVFTPDTEEPPTLTAGRQIEPFSSFVDRDDWFFRTARTTFYSVLVKICPPFGTPFLLSLA